MSAYQDKLFALMKRCDQLLADMDKLIKKIKIIRDDAYPYKKTITKDDYEKYPPLKRETERYKKKLNEFCINSEELIRVMNDVSNDS